MNNMEKTQQDSVDSRKNQIISLWYIIIPIIASLLLLGTYLLKFHSGLSGKHEDFGTFGDYLGGVLNPILSFMAIVLLVNQLRMQQEEIRLARDDAALTRQEMAQARAEAAKAAEAQKNIAIFSKQSLRIQEIERAMERVIASWPEPYERIDDIFDELKSSTSAQQKMAKKLNDSVTKLHEVYSLAFEYLRYGGGIFYISYWLDRGIEAYTRVWDQAFTTPFGCREFLGGPEVAVLINLKSLENLENINSSWKKKISSEIELAEDGEIRDFFGNEHIKNLIRPDARLVFSSHDYRISIEKLTNL